MHNDSSHALLYNMLQSVPVLSPGRIGNLSIGAFSVLMCGFLFARQLYARQFSNVSGLLMLNLILTDFFGGISCVLSSIFINRFLSDTPAYAAGCKSAWFIILLATGWSEWAVVFVTFDRYDAVANSLRRKFSKKKAIVCLSISSLIVFAFPLLVIAEWCSLQARVVRFSPFLKGGICILNSRNVNGSRDLLAFGAAYYTATFSLPTLLTTTFLILMLSFAWRLSKRLNSRLGSSEQDSSDGARATMKLLRSRGFRFVIGIIVCKIVSICPLQIYNLGLLAETFEYNVAAYVASNILYSANFAVTSILYVVWLRETALPPRDRDGLSVRNRPNPHVTAEPSNEVRETQTSCL
ncbi:uncharacterized protein [Oscarella lobularis]|uniref:uncharacterized protein n=1 Tax=Oscarella lobularis TaxID=121494 RepID=UPI003313C05E